MWIIITFNFNITYDMSRKRKRKQAKPTTETAVHIPLIDRLMQVYRNMLYIPC